MANLVAIAYDDMDQAESVMRSIGELVQEHSLTLEDAVVVLVRESTRDKVVPEVSEHGGRLIQSSLSNEQEEALQEALDNRGAVV